MDKRWTTKDCRDSGCNYFDGFGCDRSPVIKADDEICPCDITLKENRKNEHLNNRAAD